MGWSALAWVMLLHGLGSFGLVGPDEPRYAAIAAAMLHRHDWVTPWLWGAPWFEKPVLYYWLAAVTQGVFHVGAAAARLPNALLALLLSAGLGWFLHRVHSRRAGLLGALFSLTTAFLFIFGRAATTDMTLTVPWSLAMMALYLEWYPAAAALVALAALAKGPIAVVLAAMVGLAFWASQRNWRRLARCLAPAPVMIFLAVAAPWYAAVQWRNPAFFRVFVLQHNLERFATNRFEHPQPVWFYIPVLLLALAPWTGWLVLPLAAAGRRFRERGWRRAWNGDDAPLKFYLSFWTLAPVAFFSISQSKLPGYILPAVPGAVALMAVYAAETWERGPRWPLMLSAALAGWIPAGVRLTNWFLAPRALRPPLASLLRTPPEAVLAIGTTALLLVLALRRRTALLLGATAVIVAAGAWSLTRPPVSHDLDVALSGRPLAQAIRAECATGLPTTCASVPLYSWNLNRSLLYGVQYELDGTLAEWPPEGTLPPHALVIVGRDSAARFVDAYGAGRHIAQIGHMQPQSELPAPWLALELSPPPH